MPEMRHCSRGLMPVHKTTLDFSLFRLMFSVSKILPCLRIIQVWINNFKDSRRPIGIGSRLANKQKDDGMPISSLNSAIYDSVIVGIISSQHRQYRARQVAPNTSGNNGRMAFALVPLIYDKGDTHANSSYGTTKSSC